MTIAASPVEFMGLKVHPMTMDETLERVAEIICEQKTVQQVSVNVAKVVLAQKDAQLRGIINDCGLVNADGQGVVWGMKFLGVPVPERVTGIDLFMRIVERAATAGWRLYFLGAQPEVVQTVVNIFKAKYPTLHIAGFRDGYFTVDETGAVAEDIRASNADVLFVAMGSPQKEYFLNHHAQAMAVPFVMGVGGSFDVVAGVTKRAPRWMQKCGLEWFYRFMCEPTRLWRRYLVTNTVFVWMLLKARMRRGKG